MCGRDGSVPAPTARANARFRTDSSRLMVAFFAPSSCRRTTYRRTLVVVMAVIVEDVADGGAEREPGDRRAHARSEGPTVALFQTCFGHRYLVGGTARPWMRAVV